jgi:uncharacterized protein (DUF427 family)
VIAESDRTEIVEGNHYFPTEDIHPEYFKDSNKHTVCPWKGVASYYDIDVDGNINRGGAWYYPEASSAAKHIEGHVAFWQGVTVED